MPITTCLKCQGKLRLPDDFTPRRVKCPTCGNVFFSSGGDNPEDPSARPNLSSKGGGSKDDFDLPMDDDRPRRRRDEDDDDRERRNRRRDDDYDDRDRRRNRRDDEYDGRDRRRRRDDDDDDSRERNRRRQEEDDYDDRRRDRRDDDYDRSRRRREDPDAIEGQFNRASLACLLYFIGGWLQVGAFGLVAFVVFLHWCGIFEGLQVFLVVAGLLGLGYWLTSATGFGFLVSGPRKHGALGLSIATAATAGLHLMLIIVIATNRTWGGFAGATGDRTAEVFWDAFVTQLRALPTLLFLEVGFSGIRLGHSLSSGSLLPVVTNLAEIARLILFLLTLRAVMQSLRDYGGASLAMKAVIGFAIGAGGLVVIGMLFGLLLLAVRPNGLNKDAFDAMSTVGHLYSLVSYLILAGLGVGITIIVRSIKQKLDYR